MAILVMIMGFWAYRENYATHASIKELRAVRQQIAASHAELDRLTAEWAYLNRPDRLRELVEMNYARLELGPMQPENFAKTSEAPKPLVGPLPLGAEEPQALAEGGAPATLSDYIVSTSSSSSEEPL